MKDIRRRLLSAAGVLTGLAVVVAVVVIRSREGFHLHGHISRERIDIQNLLTQLQIYEALNDTPPCTEQGLQALVTKPVCDSYPRRWRQMMPELPRDSWGNQYFYSLPSTHDAAAGYDIFSARPDCIPGTADDICSWQ